MKEQIICKNNAIAAQVSNDETTLVPQYLSTLVPSKCAAFTKPSRGTSDSERRTIINGNRVFRFDCERCHLTRGAAFTLAEVLITLSIIGVVAAMTMPTLIANYQKNRAITQLKKAYSELSQAVRLSEAYNGETKEWNYNLGAKDFYEAYLKNYLKSIQELSYGDYSVKYINLDNSNCEEAWCNQAESYYVMLADGAVIAVSNWIDNGDDTKYKAITIDINGKKVPNKTGIDYFAYTIQERGLVPYGVGYYVRGKNAFGSDNNDRDLMTSTRRGCSSTGTGTFCSALILHDNWQIKYDYK